MRREEVHGRGGVVGRPSAAPRRVTAVTAAAAPTAPVSILIPLQKGSTQSTVRPRIVKVDSVSVEEMNTKTFHRASSITAQRTGFNHVVLSDMLVLKMSSHGNLSLKSPITNWAMVRQSFGMGCKMFSKVIFPEEPFLANSTLVRLDSSVAHLVTPHISTIRKLHVANITFEHFAVISCV